MIEVPNSVIFVLVILGFAGFVWFLIRRDRGDASSGPPTPGAGGSRSRPGDPDKF